MKVEITFNDCYGCPLKTYIYEQGCCGDFCDLIFYGKTPSRGIREDCPLKKGFIHEKESYIDGNKIVYEVKEGR